MLAALAPYALLLALLFALQIVFVALLLRWVLGLGRMARSLRSIDATLRRAPWMRPGMSSSQPVSRRVSGGHS